MNYRAFPLARSVEPENIVYVGVHNRRTDHLQYQAEGGWITLQPGYFLEALEVYRQWAWRSNKHLVFLFVSDDLGWAREKLLPRIKTKGGVTTVLIDKWKISSTPHHTLIFFLEGKVPFPIRSYVQ